MSDSNTERNKAIVLEAFDTLFNKRDYALHKLGNRVIIAGRRRGHLGVVVSADLGMPAIELDIADPACRAGPRSRN